MTEIILDINSVQFMLNCTYPSFHEEFVMPSQFLFKVKMYLFPARNPLQYTHNHLLEYLSFCTVKIFSFHKHGF